MWREPAFGPLSFAIFQCCNHDKLYGEDVLELRMADCVCVLSDTLPQEMSSSYQKFTLPSKEEGPFVTIASPCCWTKIRNLPDDSSKYHPRPKAPSWPFVRLWRAHLHVVQRSPKQGVLEEMGAWVEIQAMIHPYPSISIHFQLVLLSSCWMLAFDLHHSASTSGVHGMLKRKVRCWNEKWLNESKTSSPLAALRRQFYGLFWVKAWFGYDMVILYIIYTIICIYLEIDIYPPVN